MTGRISMTSESARRASRVMSVSPWITSTDSGFSSRRARSLTTDIGPGISNSRRGLRSRIFIASRLPAAPHTSELVDLARLDLEAQERPLLRVHDAAHDPERARGEREVDGEVAT